MMFKLAAVVPLISLFVSSAMAAGSATTCFSGCMEKAAATVGCAITDHRCVQEAVGVFESTVAECMENQACKTMAEGTQADFDGAAAAIALRTALVPAGEFDGMLGDNASAVMSRVTPRDTGLGLERRACNTGSSLCVLSSSRCNTYCQRPRAGPAKGNFIL
ncbi:hypothetical protein H1R20_g15271, partial [Candolleomyces eurysporus]